MQQNVKPIHLPDMPTYMRAENQDPGQSSPRSHLETHIIKSLIVSYFDTVRKSMNDMVPKTIMAFLVNKTKNLTQRELVAALYSEGVNLNELLTASPRVRSVAAGYYVYFAPELRDEPAFVEAAAKAGWTTGSTAFGH